MQDWHFVILWTDKCVYLLIAMLLLFIWRVLSNRYLKETWRAVFWQPVTIMATIILSAYLLVGFVDSIHFKSQVLENDSRIQSVLDAWLKPRLAGEETSYSAPFSMHLYEKSTIETSDGRQIRDYPALAHGGQHLLSSKDRGRDILERGLKGALNGLLALGGLFIVMQGLRRLSASKAHGMTFPWKSFYGTFGLLFIFIGACHEWMSVYHILGTSKVGEDIFYQSMKSIRTGLVIGSLTTLFMLPFATLLGITAGYLRGWVDDVIQYLYTTLSAVPGVLLIAAMVLMLQVYMGQHMQLFDSGIERADARLLMLCLILGATSWTGLCRLLRGQVLKLSRMEYIQAAKALGVGHTSIVFRHLLPNVMHIILIAIALDFSGFVLAEAVLSYIGVGVDPSMYSWGSMINGARLELGRAPAVWWALSSAFMFMFILVLCANLFADAVRDAFDPRMHKE